MEIFLTICDSIQTSVLRTGHKASEAQAKTMRELKERFRKAGVAVCIRTRHVACFCDESGFIYSFVLQWQIKIFICLFIRTEYD